MNGLFIPYTHHKYSYLRVIIALSPFLHFIIHCCTHTSPLLVNQLKHRKYKSLTKSHTPNVTHDSNTHRFFTGQRTSRGCLLQRTQNTSLYFTQLNRSAVCFQDNSFARTPRKTRSPIVVDACLSLRCLATDFLYLYDFGRRGLNRKQSISIVEACPFLRSCSLTASITFVLLLRIRSLGAYRAVA
jgi:hypothetical protein